VTPVPGQEFPVPSALLDAPRVLPVASRPAVPLGTAPERPVAGARPRRVPIPVLAAATLAVLESLGLLALGLTRLEGAFGFGAHPDGVLVVCTLLLLAGWVVLCAGGGAGLVDGAGRLLLVAVASGEIALLVVLAVVGVVAGDGVWQVAIDPVGELPVPALALLALGVPVAKLLLATAPSAVAWVDAGGRPRAPRPAPAVEHRGLRGATLVCIGLALTAVALVGAPADPPTPSTAAVVGAP
jgi:hypothetical protein